MFYTNYALKFKYHSRLKDKADATSSITEHNSKKTQILLNYTGTFIAKLLQVMNSVSRMYHTVQFIYICKLLYMVWVVSPPIITSSYHVKQFIDVNEMHTVASCWTVIDTHYMMHEPLNIKMYHTWKSPNFYALDDVALSR